MKDHIKEERQVSVGEGEDVETTIRMLEEAAEGLVSARFDIEVLNGGMWNFAERVVTVYGWRPMTEVEIEKAEKKREQERRARHKREAAKQEREYAEYLKLKEKYEDEDD